MADQREYFIFAQQDGTTEATESFPWSPGSGVGNQADQRYRTLDTADPIGRYPRRILARESTHSLVRVWGDGPQLGDVYQVIGSAVSTEANPTGQPRTAAAPIAIGPLTATILEMDMTDQLTVTTGGRMGVHIEVLDLDEAQHLAWVLAKWKTDNCCEDQLDTESRQVEVPEGGIELAPWDADVLFVEANSADGAAGGSLALPLLTSVPLGARVRIWRNSNGLYFFVVGQPGDPINGNTSHKVLLGAENTATWIERSALGWTSTLPPVDLNPISVTNSTSLSVPDGERTRVLWVLNAESVLELPNLELVAPGQEIEISVVSMTGRGGEVAPAGGQLLDGIQDQRIPVSRVGDTIIVRRSAPDGSNIGASWVTTSNCAYLARNVQVLTSDPGLGAHAGWRGLRVYIADYTLAGNFSLPTDPMIGTEIMVVNQNTNATAVTLDGGANKIIHGGANAVTYLLLANVPVRLVYVVGPTGTKYWIG